jgi:2-polyprenyl-6-methoxyphenol hydroxylase-like FAD-dependent oxidoreductase
MDHSTTQTKARTDYDVLVVGAGPSGLATALSAARSGARVMVVERHPGTSIFPKATGIRPRSLEILRTWGLEDEVLAGAQDVRVAASISARLVDPQLAEYSLGAAEPEALRRVSPVQFAVSPQDHLEPLLVEQVRSYGCAVDFGTELLGLVESADGTGTMVARLRAADTTYDVRARFVVGADGVASTVRELAEIEVDHLGSEGERLATLFRADLAGRLHGAGYALHMVTAPGVEGVFVASGSDSRWVYDREWQAEADEPTHEAVVAQLRAATGVADLDPDILGLFHWSFEAAVATSIRAGSVFLVGDAAHQTTPRGARGMNTGIADGHNLGWKLAWVAQGWAGEELLESYAAERHPVGVRNARASLVPTDQTAEADLTEDFGVVYRSSVVTSDEDVRTADGLPAAVPGARAPHAWVTHERRRVSTIDLYDGRLTLLTSDGRWHDAAAAVAVPLRLLTVGADLVDEDRELVSRYRLDDAAVLVRPDGHVAARLTEPADLSHAVETVLGRTAHALTAQHR